MLNSLKIIGIDPGYERLGIAVIDKPARGKETVVYSDCFRTSAKDDIHIRLHQAGQEVARILDLYKPSIMALETLFITKNQKTAMRVAEIRGILVYEAMNRGLTMHEYSPMQIKAAITGSGASDKTSMMKMLNLLVKIPAKASKMAALDDEYDAIAVALTCSARIHSRI